MPRSRRLQKILVPVGGAEEKQIPRGEKTTSVVVRLEQELTRHARALASVLHVPDPRIAVRLTRSIDAAEVVHTKRIASAICMLSLRAGLRFALSRDPALRKQAVHWTGCSMWPINRRQIENVGIRLRCADWRF